MKRRVAVVVVMALFFLSLFVMWGRPTKKKAPVAEPVAAARRAAPVRAKVADARADDAEPDDEEEDEEEPRSAEVECEVSEDLGDFDFAMIEELDPDTLEVIATYQPRTFRRIITFRPINAAGIGRLSSRHHEPKAMAWVQGACTSLVEIVPHPTRKVAGHASGNIEVGAVAVHARCDDDGFAGFSGSMEASGDFEMTIPVDQTCSLVVTRVFGGRDLSGDPVPVAGTTGDVSGVQLEVPEAPGLGMGLYPVEGGLRVYGVDKGSPAERAGLEMMDLVLAIDGEPATELDLEVVLNDLSPMKLDVRRGAEALVISVVP